MTLPMTWQRALAVLRGKCEQVRMLPIEVREVEDALNTLAAIAENWVLLRQQVERLQATVRSSAGERKEAGSEGKDEKREAT